MRSARTMCFYTALGATHRFGRFGHVHVLPVTHEEGFPLTRREFLYLFFDQAQGLCAFDLICTRLRGRRSRFGLVGGEYIKCLLVLADCVRGLFEGAPLDTLEEVVEFFVSGHAMKGGRHGCVACGFSENPRILAKNMADRTVNRQTGVRTPAWRGRIGSAIKEFPR